MGPVIFVTCSSWGDNVFSSSRHAHTGSTFGLRAVVADRIGPYLMQLGEEDE